jgi:hypothetical protein
LAIAAQWARNTSLLEEVDGRDITRSTLNLHSNVAQASRVQL